MTLSPAEMSLIFAGCVLAIGVVVALWRRNVFGPKEAPAAPAVGAASGGEVAE